MIVCSNCQHDNLTGAMFCAECGASFAGVHSLIKQSLGPEKYQSVSKKSSDDPSQIQGRFFRYHSEMNLRWDASAKASPSGQTSTFHLIKAMTLAYRVCTQSSREMATALS